MRAISVAASSTSESDTPRHPDARFGLVASSRDRDLECFGAPNGFQETQRVNTCVHRYRTFTLERLSDSREVDAGRTMGVDTAATGAYS